MRGPKGGPNPHIGGVGACSSSSKHSVCTHGVYAIRLLPLAYGVYGHDVLLHHIMASDPSHDMSWV